MDLLASLLLEERSALCQARAVPVTNTSTLFFSLFKKLYVYLFILYECMYVSAHIPQCALGGQIRVSSSTSVGPGNGPQVISLGGRFLNLLSPLAFSFSFEIRFSIFWESYSGCTYIASSFPSEPLPQLLVLYFK